MWARLLLNKYTLAALAALLVALVAWRLVATYDNAILEAQELEQRLNERTAQLQAARDEISMRKAEYERMQHYYLSAELRRQQGEARIRGLLSRRSTRDEAGNIADNDLVDDLNGLFPQTNNETTTPTPGAPAVPE